MHLFSTSSDSGASVGELRALLHKLNNDLQGAVSEAEMLAEHARYLQVPIELRRDVAAVLDRLDEVGRVAGGIQRTVAALAPSLNVGGGSRA